MESVFAPEILLAMVVIIMGSFIQSATGFGLAIATAPILIFISIDYVPAPITIIGLILSLFNAWQYRHNFSLQGLLYALVGRVPGSLAGGVVLLWVNSAQLTLLIGLSVMAAVLISLLPVRIQPTPNRLAVAGFFSGLFGTSAGIGGPPMALLLQHAEANAIRANLSAFFVASSILSLLVQGGTGYLNWHHVELTLPLIPACMAGYYLARKTNHLFSKQQIRYMSLTLCSVSGVSAVVSYWYG